jgi:DNA end-binding protein Ku
VQCSEIGNGILTKYHYLAVDYERRLAEPETKVDAETGEEVESSDIMKSYKVDTDSYLEVTKDELENIALESTRTIDIDQFVPRSEIDDLYLVRPYYIVPDGKVGHGAYAVIRETIRSMDKVALARVVLTNREHVISLEARDK